MSSAIGRVGPSRWSTSRSQTCGSHQRLVAEVDQHALGAERLDALGAPTCTAWPGAELRLLDARCRRSGSTRRTCVGLVAEDDDDELGAGCGDQVERRARSAAGRPGGAAPCAGADRIRVPCPAARMTATRAPVLGGSPISWCRARAAHVGCTRLPDQDSNLDRRIQSPGSYRWTIGHQRAQVALRVPDGGTALSLTMLARGVTVRTAYARVTEPRRARQLAPRRLGLTPARTAPARAREVERPPAPLSSAASGRRGPGRRRAPRARRRLHESCRASGVTALQAFGGAAASLAGGEIAGSSARTARRVLFGTACAGTASTSHWPAPPAAASS